MALADILSAIDQDAQHGLMNLRKEHNERLMDMKRASQERIDAFAANLAKEKEQKLRQLHGKASTLAEQRKKQVLAQKRQEIVDETFHTLKKKVSSLPIDQAEGVLRNALKRIGKKPGLIRPAKNHKVLLQKLLAEYPDMTLGEPIDAIGGFRFESDTVEADMTFEALIESLRSSSELPLSHLLFS